ncbi:hypothetical protein PSA7680_03151 [Pseudoruegeria aquimaris]|uniref:Inner membrane protein YjgN n=1 Tax=Pseudoruegeria aquimaris TaxID=393663 RepID=A0A1Y5TBK0_9RHOB|nr:DUF898 family protein [Pseudoruegeria aquimaris]SLN60093.1 hypothetical protein PSA7680_03151 [Pseudoruegeria aquimaris]
MEAALHTEFAGQRRALFRLALRTALLTVLTLGIYRFWMKTRLRRFYWSSVRPGGIPLEYAGEPLEKLLGFLVAVVVMAFYLGVVNLALMFASFSLLNSAMAAYAVSFLGVLPVIFYASYRARRYILARTRWRGIRFGLEPGAWGYAWRCIAHWLVTLLSLGLLLPRQTFWLEKYRADRTRYGSARLVQGGSWRQMYGRAMMHVLIGIFASLLFLLVGINGSEPGALWGLCISLPWLLVGLIAYRVETFRYLTNHKRLGGLRFAAAPRLGRVVWITVRGWIGVVLVVGGLATAGAVAITFAVHPGGFDGVMMDDMGIETGEAEPDAAEAPAGEGAPGWLFFLALLPLYFAVFTLYGVLRHVFLTLPLARHYAETLTLLNPRALEEITQRDRDHFAEAEGFADALDVGAAF